MDFKKLAVLGSAMAFGLYLSACGDDSSSGPTGDGGKQAEGKGGDEDALLPEISGEGCDFKKEDKVWSYSFTVGQGGLQSKTYRFYTYNEKGSKDSVVAVSTGKEASMACSFLGGDNKTVDEDEDVKRTQITECHDNAMWTIDVTEYFYESESRDEAFDHIMSHCQNLNDYDKEDLQEMLDSLKNSAGGENDEDGSEEGSEIGSDDGDENGSEAESSSSESDDPDVKSSSSQVSEPEDDSSSSISAEIKCDFSKDDNVWNISMAGLSDMIIEWTDNGPVAVTKTDLQMAELCETMASSMDEEGVEASCDGSVLVMKDANQYAGASKDDLYESFSAVCSAE